ncbi:MAG: DUF2911 domain-containing protein [Flavipsychrobacter sp.]|nr:DUF2911 domain-containing protein [Flavipsychrobacter sp.]
MEPCIYSMNCNGRVDYGKLWRTGAGNCTKISFNQPVTIANTSIQPGTYSIFTIPGKTEWTVILNTDTSLYGNSGYNQQKDVIRFKVTPTTTSKYFESFTIDLDIVPNNALLYLSWEKTQISFRIETETEKNVTNFISQQLLSNQSTNPDDYANASEYHYYLGKDLDLALTLINKAVQLKNESWYYRQKIDILEKLKKYKEAIECAELAIALNQERADWDAESKERSKKEYEQRINYFKSKQHQK